MKISKENVGSLNMTVYYSEEGTMASLSFSYPDGFSGIPRIPESGTST